jgi:hypothetical protein
MKATTRYLLIELECIYLSSSLLSIIEIQSTSDKCNKMGVGNFVALIRKFHLSEVADFHSLVTKKKVNIVHKGYLTIIY